VVVPVEFVADTSFTMPWFFRQESVQLSEEAWEQLARQSAIAHVPSLWPFEMANAALRGPRGGVTKPSRKDVEMFFSIVAELPIRVHHQSVVSVFEESVALMTKHKLTAYDAAYLNLALKLKLPIATLDAAIAKAALAEGVEVLK
jgi:predicted nucleic acid-binding protein